jgi:DNA-binding NtrC family response regulator
MALPAPAPELQHNRKTIFIVDDEPDILKCVSEILADNGYDVQTYQSGEEALQQSRDYKGEIHLLLSDFQMPGLSGVELATEMTAGRPQLKVLLMSGFPAGMLVLNEGWHFLAKPFITSQLRALVAGLADPDRPSKYTETNTPSR